MSGRARVDTKFDGGPGGARSAAVETVSERAAGPFLPSSPVKRIEPMKRLMSPRRPAGIIGAEHRPDCARRDGGPSGSAEAGMSSRRLSFLAPAGGRTLARLAAAAAVAVLAQAAEGAGGLFAAAGPASAGSAAVAAGDPVLRRRLVTLDAGMLERARSTAARRAAEPTLVLNLFEDAAFHALIESEAPTFSGGYSLSGRLVGDPLGSVTLVVNGDVVAGTVSTLGGTYSIESGDDGVYVVSELDPSRLVEHGAVVAVPGAWPGEGDLPHRR